MVWINYYIIINVPHSVKKEKIFGNLCSDYFNNDYVSENMNMFMPMKIS